MQKKVFLRLALLFAVVPLSTLVSAGLEEGNIAYQKQDFTTAWSELLPAAKAGNPHAQQLVADMYLTGSGVASDAAEAARWLDLSAKQGDVPAMNALAHLYVQGMGVQQDLNQAAYWFRRAVSPAPNAIAAPTPAANPAADAEAPVSIAQTPCKQVTPTMPRAAIKSLTFGTVRAGVFLVDGVPKDVIIFFGPRMYHEAVRRAMMQYACSPTLRATVAQQDFVFNVEDGSSSFSIQQLKPAFRGQQPAMDANWQGLTVQQRQAVHTQYPNMASQDEPPYPQGGMGSLLEDLRLMAEHVGVQGGLRLQVRIEGNGTVSAVNVLESPDLAFSQQVTTVLNRTAFKAAVCNGQPCAMDMPIDASIAKKEMLSPQAELDRLQANAKAGDAKAQNTLGTRFESGRVVPKDMAQAVNWYRQSAGQGLSYAQFNLARMYQYGRGIAANMEAAGVWYRKAAEQGHSGAQRELGEMLLHGAGVPQNLAEGIQWIQKSADQGNAWGQFSLGNAYHEGIGVPQNFALAVRWYQKSADQGNAGGQNNLADSYENGHGVAVDLALALKWYRLAADQRQFVALYSLAQMYQDGRGVAKDPAKAMGLLKEAAELGHAKAQFEMAQHYAVGNGVAKSDATAAEWYRKAAKNGHQGALAQLKELGLTP